MRVLIQRVKCAEVKANGDTVAGIGKGLLLFVSIGGDDDEKDILQMAKKVVNLRIFEDNAGKMNLNISQVNGEILSVSQFTLHANTRKGNRPSFEQAAAPETAFDYWRGFNNLLREDGINVEEGLFGEHMEVDLINSGPVTIWLDTKP
jgi:D-tyrosyl-tRNA(Tyr) deacylase